MDTTAVAGMAFVVIMTALIGGIILLAPVSKRVALLLERKLQEKQAPADHEARQLHERVQLLEDEVRLLGERQQFTDNLLQRGKD